RCRPDHGARPQLPDLQPETEESVARFVVSVLGSGYSVFCQSDNILSDDVKKSMGEQIPLKRFGQTKDIAETVAFLASDLAGYITGQVIQVDGGMAM
ncbi:MAG: SDR family oxidoreductase, partial [Lachnospiraceae bacterium]|nr:SDR family oxidoreductase [Lachnospiraceae bacterium]